MELPLCAWFCPLSLATLFIAVERGRDISSLKECEKFSRLWHILSRVKSTTPPEGAIEVTLQGLQPNVKSRCWIQNH